MPTPEVVSEGNVVFVTFNYRLNVFGFLTLDIFNESTNITANYGLTDQALLLQWVQENIEAFGGNPKKVFFIICLEHLQENKFYI